jgi:hypothetical protein
MTRIRRHATELTRELELALMVGPMPITDHLSDEDLGHGWRLHDEQIMRDWEFRHGSRPWGWWVFEKGEDPPPLEPGAKEMAELGELTERELEDLRNKAVVTAAMLEGREPISFVMTGGGKTTKDFIREHVEIYERVEAALTDDAHRALPDIAE